MNLIKTMSPTTKYVGTNQNYRVNAHIIGARRVIKLYTRPDLKKNKKRKITILREYSSPLVALASINEHPN